MTWMSGDDVDPVELDDAALPLPPKPPPPPAVPVPRVEDDCPDPVPLPVVEVPPVPLLDRFSPAVTFTCDTVPSNVATTDAPARACCALVRSSLAESTDVWSAVIWSADAPDAWSSESFACAVAIVDCALVTAAANWAESRVASTWPEV